MARAGLPGVNDGLRRTLTFFGSSWAHYDQAKPGTFRLVPPTGRQPALRRDYQAMRDIYLTEPVSFDDILANLADLEHRINHASAG